MYILVDNILVWARAKLKRAVYFGDLIRGVPVPIESITDNNGRNTIVDICYILKDTLAGLMSGCSSEADGRKSEIRKSMCRTCFVAFIRLVPLLILILVFLLDFGTGDSKRCKQEKVQFTEPNMAAFLADSLKCANIRDKETRQNGATISFRVEYVESASHQNSHFCGCKSRTESLCMSSYNNITSKAPKVATWNTTVSSNKTAAERTHSRMDLLQRTRDEFAFPGTIPWKDVSRGARNLFSTIFITCFIYADKSRLSTACVREYALAIAQAGKKQPKFFNEVLLFAKTAGSVSFIQYYSVKMNNPMENLAGALDGSKGDVDTPLVYRTFSKSVQHLSSDKMLGLLLILILNFRWLMRNTFASESSSGDLARIVTSFVGLQDKGEGTVRHCSGTVLTLRLLGIVAAVLLLLLFFLLCALSFIKSPESPLALICRSDIFESWNWVLKALLSERAGLDMSCLARRTDEIVILNRGPELKLKITSKELWPSACTCTRSEINAII